MTATRVISDHSELSGVGTIKHATIDLHLSSSLMVVSGANAPPNARVLVAGPGLQAIDFGNTVTLQVTPASSSLTPDQHKSLTQLIHFIDDGPGDGFFTSPFKETIGFPFVTQQTWWDSANKTKRIFQTEFTRSNGIMTVTKSYKAYNPDGVTLAAGARDVITYVSGVFETYRSRSFF